MTIESTLDRGVEPSSTSRFLRLLMIAVLVVPVLLFSGAAWLYYRAAFDDANERVVRATDAIEQHALKVFETAELMLDQIAERVDDMNWPDIAHSEEVHKFLQRLSAMPDIGVVGLIAPDLAVAATSREFPVPSAKASSQDYLPVPRDGRDPLFISGLTRGSPPSDTHFTVARHKPNSDRTNGGGLIFVSLPLASLVQYYRSVIDPDTYLVTMMRSDGAVLARHPDEGLAGRVLSPQSLFQRSVARDPERGTYVGASQLDQRERLFAYRKVGTYPVYVAVGLARMAVVNGWLGLMARCLMLGLPVVAALILLTLVAKRHSDAADRAMAAAREEADRRLAAEDSLRHAQQMEAVGQLTGGVAHDFNNLLTVITGSLDMILRRVGDPGRVRRLTESALRAAARGERLTQQLLMFSRRQVMHPETLNLNRVLLEFEALMRRAAGEKIELELKLDAGLDPSRVDRTQLEATVLNLVVNARDAMPTGGRLTVETQNIVLDDAYAAANSEAATGACVMIAVSDNGCGIARDVLPHVFEPFFTTKEVGRGSGLGLSQVYGFAKESGGHVQIYSEVGMGTTVKLYLPKSSTQPVAESRRTLIPLRVANGGETVLVVEDDEDVLAMAVESLSDLGYKVLIAHDGEEALAIVRGSQQIDILFSDIVMPGGINGAQLAVEARRLRPDIKVLLTSGYTGAALRNEHGLPDDLPVLGKPYRHDQLAAQLRVIIGGQHG
jgi:signal transduction histidine kinase